VKWRHLLRAPRLARAALGPLVAVACGAPTTARTGPEPAAPAAPGARTAVPPASGTDTARLRRGYTDGDVRFMQRMIGHHGQALAMAALVPARSRREDLRLLAERITVSQQDEIAAMQRWLRARGETVPAPDAHAAHGAVHDAAMPGMADTAGMAAMPGMATPAEMEALAALSGPAFDARFLDLMIRHHEGALTMVAELFAARGAGQDPQVFSLATDVDADQRAEIARMRAMQGAPAAR